MLSSFFRILIVDDDKDDFFITSEHIKKIPRINVQIDWCDDYDTALNHIAHRNYDIYFVDYLLGAKSGVELLQDALKLNCEEPIVMLTGKGRRLLDIEAMESGAVDFLVKSEINTEKVERSIRYALLRSRSIKALKASEQKYRSVFEQLKDVIFVADTALHLLDINDAAIAMFGYSKEHLLAMRLTDLLVPLPDMESSAIALIHAKGEDVEVVLKTADGEWRNCIVSATTHFDTKGSAYVQGVIHDITKLKKAERAILQSEKLAATGRLVRTLAHEVRNPLNNIILSVEQMKAEGVDETVQFYSEIVLRNSSRINSLITALLSTSRPTDIVLKPIDITVVIDTVLNRAADSMLLKGVSCERRQLAEHILIEADADKLPIALFNIIINGIEAVEEGKGLIRVNVEMDESYAIINIADNGSGISDENIARLFEPYFTQKRNGLGLGLAASFNIVQAHKGRIEVASEPGNGAVFSVYIPLYKD
ncbi:MAG TPA: PAS domain S-box protein [Flavipsychrobacter sp.]|nr:PAS domain S-box protein [Flavipsychrobacter sp.]